jgi:hypothetical protein
LGWVGLLCFACLTWTITDRCVERGADNANVKWLIRRRQTLDMAQVCKG